jgi:hypothetical protein
MSCEMENSEEIWKEEIMNIYWFGEIFDNDIIKIKQSKR